MPLTSYRICYRGDVSARIDLKWLYDESKLVRFSLFLGVTRCLALNYLREFDFAPLASCMRREI